MGSQDSHSEDGSSCANPCNKVQSQESSDQDSSSYEGSNNCKSATSTATITLQKPRHKKRNGRHQKKKRDGEEKQRKQGRKNKKERRRKCKDKEDRREGGKVREDVGKVGIRWWCPRR